MVTLLIPRLGLPATRGTLFMLRKKKVRVVGVDRDPEVPMRNAIDAFFTVPPDDDPAYSEVLADICQKEGVDLILPQSDFPFDVGPKIIAPKPDVARRAGDKVQLLQRFLDLELPCPDHEMILTPEEFEPAAKRLGYPDRDLIIKPAVSRGTRGFYLLSGQPLSFDTRCDQPRITLEQLSNLETCPTMVMMEYLPGPEYTVDAFIGERAAVAIPRLRNQIVGGTSFVTTLDYRLDLIDTTLKAARSLGLTSLFGMQYKLSEEGIPMIIECNPRLGGTLIASYFSGVNLVAMAIDEALGNPHEQPKGPFKAARFVRHWGGICGDTEI